MIKQCCAHGLGASYATLEFAKDPVALSVDVLHMLFSLINDIILEWSCRRTQLNGLQ
jgi:hypothetical protein